MTSSTRVFALVLASAALVSPALAFEVGEAEVFYLDATDPDNGFTLAAEAGDYEIYPASDADHVPGAWNAWGIEPTDCDEAGMNCQTGFLALYTIGHPGGSIVSNEITTEGDVETRRVYETADIALAEAATETLCLDEPGEISLSIEDEVYTDNLYGLAVHVVRLNDVCGGGDSEDGDPADSGCSTAPVGGGAWALLGILGLVGRRRLART